MGIIYYNIFMRSFSTLIKKLVPLRNRFDIRMFAGSIRPITAYTPCGSRLLVEMHVAETITKSGIILQSPKGTIPSGTIVKMGLGDIIDGKRSEQSELTVGSEVILPEYGGSSFKVDENGKEVEYKLFRWNEIQAVITKK